MFKTGNLIAVFSASLTIGFSPCLKADTLRVPQQHDTIQEAIDAAKFGDTVIVSSGIYRERIRLQNGITLKSIGNDERGKIGLKRAETTIIDGNFEGAKGPGVAMAENSTLDGFTVTGVGKYDDALWMKHWNTFGEQQAHEPIGAPGTAGISVQGIEHSTITNNIVHHIGYTGIAIVGSPGKQVSPRIISNVAYRNMGGGIGSMNQSTAVIQGNKCFENFYAGIGHSNASPLVFENTCYRNVRAGIGISEHACPIVRENLCYHNRRAGIGIRTGKKTQPIIESNQCYENEMAGIGNREDAHPIIRQNKCFRNKMAGIGSRDRARGVIEDNDCYENGMAGIGSRLESAPVIRNNRCYRNMMAGIGSRERARPVIESNECFENRMAGIGNRNDAAPVIRGNRCYRNVMAGIGSRLGSKPIIVENNCFQNNMAGIGSREGAAPIIRSNHTHENQMAGIGSRRGARPVIADNLSENNRKAGIGVRDPATVAVIIGNRSLENRLVAIGVPDGGTAYIHGNELKRTGGGAPPIVAIRGGSRGIVSDNLIHEGGVAGVLVSGTAQVTGNEFIGRGPEKQGSAIWVPFGGSFSTRSNVLAANNHCRGYRNLLNANQASITATNNLISDFSGPSLIVKKPTTPARVFDNLAIADQPENKVLDVEGLNNTNAGNQKKMKSEPEIPEKTLARWPLLTTSAEGETYHPLFGSGQTQTVSDQDWKLVVSYGKSIKYSLFDVRNDSPEESDLSSDLEQITFRLRGLLEQKEALEYQSEMGR